MSHKRRIVKSPSSRSFVIDEEVLYDFWIKNSVNNEIKLTQARKFVDILNDVDFDTTILELFPYFDDDELMSLQEFKILIFTCRLKSNLHISMSMTPPPISHNQLIMRKFKEYTEMTFQEDEHNHLLLELWHLAFPDETIPEIPSKKWEKLGFQGVNPATDFRGSGKCGIDCLLALVRHQKKFFQLWKSAENHGIPFATAGINVVMFGYAFLGWGFKSPRVPSGRCPQTYKTLCKLLFGGLGNSNDVEKSLMIAKTTFYKIFYIIFETLVQSWEEVKGSYFDFPKIMSITSEKVEETFMTIKDKFDLDRYLVDKLHLDITLIHKEQAFRIYLPELNYKAIVYDPKVVLEDILKKLTNQRDLKNYVPYDLKGAPIINMEIPLSLLDIKGIYFYPKDQPPSPLQTNLPFPFETPSKHGNNTTNKTISLPNLPPVTKLEKFGDELPPLPPIPVGEIPSRLALTNNDENYDRPRPNSLNSIDSEKPSNLKGFKRMSMTSVRSVSSPNLIRKNKEEVPVKSQFKVKKKKKKPKGQMEGKEIKEKLEKPEKSRKERGVPLMVRRISKTVLQEKNF